MVEVLELNDSNYVSFIENTNAVVFIDFYSESCGPCQTLLTYLPHLSGHYSSDNVVIAKVNVATSPKLSTKYMVQSVPLSIVIGEDKMIKHVQVGLRSIDTYIKMIDNELGKGKGFFSRVFG